MVFEKRTRVRSRFFAHHMWKQTLYHLLNTILSTIFVLVIFFVILLVRHDLKSDFGIQG